MRAKKSVSYPFLIKEHDLQKMPINEKDLKLRAEQNALLVKAERLRVRTHLIVAAASTLQEYSTLTNQLLAHIAALNAYVPNPLTTPGTVQAESRREGPTGNSGGACCAGIPGDQTERQAQD
jgi:hypothetical protein